MNFLSKVKAFNGYDFIVNNFYKNNETEEPLTDIEGSTALLLTDGTSWEFEDGKWCQIEQSLDEKIKNNFYSFLMSVCNSIHNHFIQIPFSAVYTEVKFTKSEDLVSITGIKETEKIYVAIEDFIMIKTETCNYLTQVKEFILNDDEEVIGFKVCNNGVNIRITGENEIISVCLVSFPMGFIDVVAQLMAYDLFERTDKEKKVERLGNYSVTNANVVDFYGDGAYPQYLLEKIKYWQRIMI